MLQHILRKVLKMESGGLADVSFMLHNPHRSKRLNENVSNRL